MIDANSLFNPLNSSSSVTTPSAQIQPAQPFSPSMFQTPPSASIPGYYQVGTGSQDIVSSAVSLLGVIPPPTPSTMVTPSHFAHFQQPVCKFQPHFLQQATAPIVPLDSGLIPTSQSSLSQVPVSSITTVTQPQKAVKPKIPKVKRKDRTQSSGIPLELRDEEKFYCEKCPRSYKTEWDLKVYEKECCGRVGYKPWKCR